MSYRVYLPQDRTPTAMDRVLGRPGVIFGALAVLAVLPLVLLWLAWGIWGDAIRAFLSSQFWFSVLMMAISLLIIIHLCAACILAERKIAAFVQDRKGPNRVGFWGLLQPVADGLKFILKEESIPANVDKPIFLLAPGLAFAISLVTFAVIPWAGEIEWPWTHPAGVHPRVTTQVASLDIGVLYILALGSLSVYGVVLAGWSSNNKYSFYGGMRATAQMLSYEVPLGLAILIVLLTCGTLRLEVIVDQQAASGVWNILLHPLACLLLLAAAFAETNRAPFDVVECEQELIGGYHTEYSAMKLGLFYLAEYAHMIVASALIATLFFGGWAPLPVVSWLAGVDTWWAALIKFAVIWGKVGLFIGLYMLVRWTLPRFRFDQIMRLAWKGLVPMGMGLLAGAGVLVALGWERNVLACLALNAIVLGLSLYVAVRSPRPITGRQEDLPEVEVLPNQALTGR